MANMSYSAYHSSKRKDIEKEKPEHGDDLSWMLKTDSNATCLLLSLHNLYSSWFFI